MTHFSALVITEDSDNIEQAVDAALLPYTENRCMELPKEYLEFYEDEGCEVDIETGLRGYWINPNAEWDWYVIGGRWHNVLKLNDGTRGDSAFIRDIDTSRDESAYQTAKKAWEKRFSGGFDKLSDSERKKLPFELSLYTDEGLKETYGDADFYARACSEFSFFAVVTPDGEWHDREVGTLYGLWGSNDGSKEWLDNFLSDFIAPYPDYVATVVDCHI
jgi:hypothetical protein